jgi:uncharacterized protein
MGPIAASSTIKDSATRIKFGPAYLLLVVPFVGLLGLLWVASHRIAKPDISIFQAVDEGDYSAVQAHILTGTSVNAVNQTGHTPLYMAISNRKPAIVNLLLSSGASVNAENKGQLTPLYEAAGEGNLELVQELLDKGARAGEVYVNGATALQAAANTNNVELVKLLLARGAKVNVDEENQGGTALCAATTNGNLAISKVLLAHGADVHLTGAMKRTPLHFAASSGNVQLVQTLLDHGASADAADMAKVIPLSCSLEKGDNSISRLLLAETKDVTVVQTTNDYNLLHHAVLGHADVGIIKELVRRGVDVNRRNDAGETPMTLAYEQNDQKVIDVLAAAGGRVPLTYLIMHELFPPLPKTGTGGFTGVE